MPGLWESYIAEDPALMPFYACSPRALPPSFAARTWDPGLVDTLRAYQCDLGLARTFTGNEPVVITGQQPGIFTGPLYTIYKAVTAVLLAARMQKRSGAPCIPVFWIGSDDHDFEEMRVAHFLTKSHETLALRYAPENEPGETAVNVAGFPMYRVPITPSLHQLVDEAAAQTPGAEYRENVAAFLHHTLDQSRTLDEWFARLMAALFQDTPLMFFAPHLPAARLAAAPILEREIQEPLASTRLLNETAERLRKSGYPAQVVKNDTECNFFVEMGGRRRKVLYEKERFRIPEENMTCTQEDLLTLLHAAPERFSPNVVLRCIVQQALFPVAACVVGPGELGYWAEVKPLFEHFGYPMPAVYPRARCTLTTLKLNKLRRKLDLSLEDLLSPEDDLIERALKSLARHPAQEAVRRRRDEADRAAAQLEADLESIVPKDRAIRDQAKILHDLIVTGFDRLERTMLHGDRKQAEAAVVQVRRLCAALMPGRKPQERLYCAFSFLFEHGPELIPRLLRSVDVESFKMNEVEL